MCASPLLDNLRQLEEFAGYVVSDLGAVRQICTAHEFVDSEEEACTTALAAGTDLNLHWPDELSYGAVLPAAVKDGNISVSQVHLALKRVLRTRFKLGLFDPPSSVPPPHLNPEPYLKPKPSKLGWFDPPSSVPSP
jgi:beta-glucosidase